MEEEKCENIPLEEADQKIAIEKVLEIKKFDQKRDIAEFIAFKEKISWELSNIICVAPKSTFQKDGIIFKIGYVFENGDVRACEWV